MDMAALKNELAQDPLNRGYAGMDDVQAADSLNASGRDVDRDSVTGGEIAASLVRSELAAISAAERAYVFALLSCQAIPLTANFKTELGAVFGPGSATRANVLTLLKRTGSRAEELGLGHVTTSHVADARRPPPT